MYNIFQIIKESSFVFSSDPKNKKNIFSEITKSLYKEFGLSYDKLINDLFKREKLGSTSLGNGIAIPHIISEEIVKPKCVISVLSKGINYDTTDENPVDLIFLLLIPKTIKSEHLQILASFSRLLRDAELTQKLRGCQSSESALAIFSKIFETKAA